MNLPSPGGIDPLILDLALDVIIARYITVGSLIFDRESLLHSYWLFVGLKN